VRAGRAPTPGVFQQNQLLLFRVDPAALAAVFASPDPKAYEFGDIPSKAALFFGEDLEDVSIGGEGTVDGEAEYEWRLDDFERAFEHKALMESLGKPLMRAFPKGFPRRQVFPHLLWLGKSKNIRVTGLRFQSSPSRTLALYGCERAVFDGLQVFSSLKEAVWADGIDLDGCRDVVITNCMIATGDDCIVFISADAWGPARVCENIRRQPLPANAPFVSARKRNSVKSED
jgi:polygalacturonase